MLAASLFSAYAEVFLSEGKQAIADLPFLCLRRGVSSPNPPIVFGRIFSLPTQRCFREVTQNLTVHELFSAYAEVFPRRKKGAS